MDLNQYNLQSLHQIESEWTANLAQKMAEKEIVKRLGVKSDRELFVDTVSVSFPRNPANPGLGIQLVEIAGGREDGLGITLVSGLVEGGSVDAAKEDIRVGDSLSKVSVIRTRRKSLSETQEVISSDTECLSYDATVDAILSLPPPNEAFEEVYNIDVKRIRRKPKLTVQLQYPPDQNEPDVTLQMFAGENLRQGMLIRGVKLNDPLAQRFDTKNGGNCGAGGLCRTCAVSIRNGEDLLNPQRVAEKQMLEDNPRWRLACKAIVGFGMKEGELTVRVNPRQWE